MQPKMKSPIICSTKVVHQPVVLVTLISKPGTSADELDHLEAVISRVCQFHVAESKPLQVPGPDQVRYYAFREYGE